MTRAKPEEDEYWNRSKLKAFTFDDEDDEFSRVSSWWFSGALWRQATAWLDTMARGSNTTHALLFRQCFVLFSQLKESKRAVNSLMIDVDDDDDDNFEKVSWSGEPVGSMLSFWYLLLSIFHLHDVKSFSVCL